MSWGFARQLGAGQPHVLVSREVASRASAAALGVLRGVKVVVVNAGAVTAAV